MKQPNAVWCGVTLVIFLVICQVAQAQTPEDDVIQTITSLLDSNVLDVKGAERGGSLHAIQINRDRLNSTLKALYNRSLANQASGFVLVQFKDIDGNTIKVIVRWAPTGLVDAADLEYSVGFKELAVLLTGCGTFGCDLPVFQLPPPPQDGGKGGSITVTDMESKSLVIAIAGCGGDGCPGDDGTCDPMSGLATDGLDGGAGGEGGSIEILKGDLKGQDELYLWAGDGGKGGKGGDGGMCETTTSSSVSISSRATFGPVGNGGKGGNSGKGGDITIRHTGAIFGNLQAGIGGGGKVPTAGGDGDFGGNGGAGGKGGSLKLVKLTIGATLIGQAGPGGDGGNGGTGLAMDGTPGRGGDGGDIFHDGIKDLSRLKPPAFQPGTAGAGTPIPPGPQPPPNPPPGLTPDPGRFIPPIK